MNCKCFFFFFALVVCGYNVVRNKLIKAYDVTNSNCIQFVVLKKKNSAETSSSWDCYYFRLDFLCVYAWVFLAAGFRFGLVIVVCILI